MNTNEQGKDIFKARVLLDEVWLNERTITREEADWLLGHNIKADSLLESCLTIAGLAPAWHEERRPTYEDLKVFIRNQLAPRD